MASDDKSPKLQSLYEIANLVNGLCLLILMVASIIVFNYIFFVRKQREPFLLIIPSLEVAYAIFQCLNYFISYENYLDIEWLLYVGTFFSMTAHWLFSTQYFKTSKMLPLMITLVEFERVRSADSGMNVNLVQDKLDKYNLKYDGDTFKTL